MNDTQKRIARYLLDKSYQMGFGNEYPLQEIADKLNITVSSIYDPNSESGLMAEYSQKGNIGLFHFTATHGSVNMDTKELTENWCEY